MKALFTILTLALFLSASPAQAEKLDTLLHKTTDQVLRDMQISLIKDLKLKEPKTLAVLPFQPIGKGSPALGEFLTEAMTTQLFGQGFWKLLERSRLDKLIKEQGFSQSALADPETALAAGKLLGAQAILIGSYTEMKDGVRLNLRLIHVGEGTVLAARSLMIQRRLLSGL